MASPVMAISARQRATGAHRQRMCSGRARPPGPDRQPVQQLSQARFRSTAPAWWDRRMATGAAARRSRCLRSLWWRQCSARACRLRDGEGGALAQGAQGESDVLKSCAEPVRHYDWLDCRTHDSVNETTKEAHCGVRDPAGAPWSATEANAGRAGPFESVAVESVAARNVYLAGAGGQGPCGGC
jgi:hypothetical protein